MPEYYLHSLRSSLLALSLVGSCLLQAEIRESADQSIAITVESVDSGGSRLTGGGFRIDSSVGSIAGDISRSGPEPAQFTSQNGYLGQLFDITGLAIGLTPATVNEEGSAQLDVSLEFDDVTVLPLDPLDVDWSVQSGPIAGVSDSGLLTADTVVDNSSAVVAAAYFGNDGTLNITVLNVDQGITGDGLPDDWQLMFFAQDSTNAGPDDDADLDGRNNCFEYAFNSSPIILDTGIDRQPLPVFLNDPTQGADQFLTITFRRRPPSAGLDYIVEVSSTLGASSWEALAVQLGETTGPDAEGMLTVTYRDNLPFTASTGRFIRIRVSCF